MKSYRNTLSLFNGNLETGTYIHKIFKRYGVILYFDFVWFMVPTEFLFVDTTTNYTRLDSEKISYPLVTMNSW